MKTILFIFLVSIASLVHADFESDLRVQQDLDMLEINQFDAEIERENLEADLRQKQMWLEDDIWRMQLEMKTRKLNCEISEIYC